MISRHLTPAIAPVMRLMNAEDQHCEFVGSRTWPAPKRPIEGPLTARHLPLNWQWSNGRSGRSPEVDHPAGFRVEQPLECPLPSAGNSQGQFPRKMIWRDFMLRSPEATNLQPQPTALKPAPTLEVASRTLARPPDKNREQRGQGGPKARKCGGCRSRGKSEKPRQNWRCVQT